MTLNNGHKCVYRPTRTIGTFTGNTGRGSDNFSLIISFRRFKILNCYENYFSVVKWMEFNFSSLSAPLMKILLSLSVSG